MGEPEDFDLDRSMMRAWARFRSDLADRIAAMDDRDILVLDVEFEGGQEDGVAPFVRFCVTAEDMVRAEVSSNAHLAQQVALDERGAVTLARLGWKAPTPGIAPPAGSGCGFYRDAERAEGERLAAMAVAALRDVFGVPHPAFLRSTDAVRECDPAGAGSEAGELAVERPDEPLAVMPESTEHLRELVAAALTPPGDPVVEFDEDGNIALPAGSALLFVRVNESAPAVELFAFVVRGVQDLQRAAFEVGVLNRNTWMVKFELRDDAVLATLTLPAAPFTPRNLRAVASSMADVIDRVDDALVARVGGRRALENEPQHGRGSQAQGGAAEAGDGWEDCWEDCWEDSPADRGVHPALLTLLRLDPDGDDEVAPELAASVCEFDSDLALTLLREASRQETAWRRSADRALVGGDTDEAADCLREAAAWAATVETLRAALQVIVRRQRADAAATRRPWPSGR